MPESSPWTWSLQEVMRQLLHRGTFVPVRCHAAGSRRLLMTEAYHSEERRREIFLALVEAQDHEMPADLSRKAIAERFGITEEALQHIGREGLDNDWPPLD